MAFPPKPANWAIYPGKLYLVTAGTAGSDTNRPTAGNQMTELEVRMCETWAWEDICAGLGPQYNVCDWGEKPPYGLERDWNMLASAYYLQMENAGMTVDGRVSPIWAAWIKMVHMELDRILSGDRVLLDSNCNPIRPAPSRTGTLAIGVAGPTTTIFAGADNVQMDQTHVGGSLQEIQRLYGRQSVTFGGQFQVTA